MSALAWWLVGGGCAWLVGFWLVAGWRMSWGDDAANAIWFGAGWPFIALLALWVFPAFLVGDLLKRAGVSKT